MDVVIKWQIIQEIISVKFPRILFLVDSRLTKFGLSLEMRLSKKGIRSLTIV